MAKVISFVIGLAIFGGWMSIVGNPHVVETVIGIFLGLIGGIYFFLK